MRKKVPFSLNQEIIAPFAEILYKEGMTIQSFFEMIANKTVKTGVSPVSLQWNIGKETDELTKTIETSPVKPIKSQNTNPTFDKENPAAPTKEEKYVTFGGKSDFSGLSK